MNTPNSSAASLLTFPPLGNTELELAAYNQNSETFRTLNALMWQIPLIAMTLTGGLWFGVSSLSKEDALALLRPGLLLLAGVGDLLLIVVLERLRHIVSEYLLWLQAAVPNGHVAASGAHWYNKSGVVKLAFQIMLGSAATVSFVLCSVTMASALNNPLNSNPKSATAWYDAHALELADSYEGVDAEKVHPELFQLLRGKGTKRILDIGAGTGRDAAALAGLGHQVTAVEPSEKMLILAKALHPDDGVTWVQDALPSLRKVQGTYDVVLLSAIWMHIPPSERATSFARAIDLTAPGGRVYITLRLGPGDVNRAIWSVSIEEIQILAKKYGLAVAVGGERSDLLERDGITWRTLVITRKD